MNKYLLFFLVLLVGCRQFEEIETIEQEATFAIPVIKNASVSFMELWQSNTASGQSLLVQSDGTLVFRYESDPVEVSTTDVLGALEFPIIAGLLDTVSTLPFTLPANLTIEEATLGGGFALFQFEPIVDKTVEITFTLPHIQLNGHPFELKTDGFSGKTETGSLEGYTFRPEGNELKIEYTAKDLNGNPVILEKLGIIARPRLQFVKGTWGREEFQLTPSIIPIDLYDEHFLNGTIRFTQPTITANIESSFGVPIRSRVDIMNAYTNAGERMPVDASAIDGVDINYPLLSERGERKKTVLQIDYTNSNIVEVFDAQLTDLEYGLTAIANPEDDQNLTVFIEDTSKFKAEVIVEVPVVGRTSHFTATETVEIPFDDIDQIEEGEFKLIVENELPIGAALQFYFKTTTAVVLDSLFDNSPLQLQAAATNNNGQVIKSSETTTFIPVSAKKMQHIIKADQVQARVIFQTARNGEQDVVIKATQQVRFRLGLRFKV